MRTARTQIASLTALLAVIGSACGDGSSVATEPACDTPTVTTQAEVVDFYGNAWREADAAARSCFLQPSFASDAIYTDPTAEIFGRNALVDHIGGFRSSSSGGGIEPTNAAEYRAGEGRFGWILVSADGVPLLPGEDWVEFDADGRLSAVHGFFGAGTGSPVPPVLIAWAEAWNASDENARRAALERATTDGVRFTDALADVSGRAALADEMARQQDLFGGYEVVLADQVYQYVTPSGVTYLRHTVDIVLSNGSRSTFTNYVTIRDGRIARLAGFPGRPMAETS